MQGGILVELGKQGCPTTSRAGLLETVREHQEEIRKLPNQTAIEGLERTNAPWDLATHAGEYLRFRKLGRQVSKIVRACKNALPETVKDILRDSRGLNWLRSRITASKLAGSSKRLDLCSAQLAHVFHLSGGLTVKDCVCVELGSGWVLSHALVFHLLGAKRVIASDIECLARPSTLYKALHSSVASIIRDVLSPFEDHGDIRARLNDLLAVKRFSFELLRELGVEYVAPIDLARRSLGIGFDFAYSNSVLEHVPADDVLPLLENLSKDLSPGGRMIHCVHLEDHKDLVNAPFEFLHEPDEKYGRDVQTRRGNRMRRSHWQKVLSLVEGMDFEILYEWRRRDRPPPSIIDSSVLHVDDEDLTTSHIGILGRRAHDARR